MRLNWPIKLVLPFHCFNADTGIDRILSNALLALNWEIAPMNLTRTFFLFAFGLFATAALGDGTTCGGINTVLYSNNSIGITICHGPNTIVDRAQLQKWQSCTDARIMKWSTNSGHPVKGINYPNEVNNESRRTNQKTV